MLHCDLRVRWKSASDLRFRAAISEPETLPFCRISGDLAPSMRKSLAIAIVRFWCAKIVSIRIRLLTSPTPLSRLVGVLTRSTAKIELDIYLEEGGGGTIGGRTEQRWGRKRQVRDSELLRHGVFATPLVFTML